jgi:hypothetical protein
MNHIEWQTLERLCRLALDEYPAPAAHRRFGPALRMTGAMAASMTDDHARAEEHREGDAP